MTLAWLQLSYRQAEANSFRPKKRSGGGTYHKLSTKHLDAYLDELEHRFNNRDNRVLFRDTLLKLVKAEKLPYSELTKAG